MNKKELKQLSKSELISMILEMESRLEKIEAQLKYFDNPHTPSSKKQKKNTKNDEETENQESTETPKRPRFPGKPNGSKGGGVRIPKVDDVKEHTLDESYINEQQLGEPIGYRIKTIIDFPNKPIKTIRHIIYQYLNPQTGEIIEPDVKLPSGIYGHNIQCITALLKNMNLSCEKIASFYRELGANSFCASTVFAICSKFIRPFEKKRTKFLKKIRKLPYIHADETGMRKDGKNTYIWTICSEYYSIFLAAKGRARSNIIKLLRNFKGVLITDGYGGYDFYPLRQRCWAHLMRDFRDIAEKDDEIMHQYLRMKKVYAFISEINEDPPNKELINMAKWHFNDILACLETIKSAKKLVTLIRRGKDDWFTALYYEGVPLENNKAERELRPLVLLRKTIGCYRNWKGKRWIDVVISVLHTWKLQKKNLFLGLKSVAMQVN